MAARGIADAYLAHHCAFRPVDASFMGLAGYDHLLPDASAGAADAERRGLGALRAMLDAHPHRHPDPLHRDLGPPRRHPGESRDLRGEQAARDPGFRRGDGGGDDVGGRLDWRLADAQARIAAAALEVDPRFLNPAWYTGEAVFSIVALLLPRAGGVAAGDVLARLEAVPDFLGDGRARLAGASAPRGLVERARREAAVAAPFLTEDLRLHPEWDARWEAPAAAAATAFGEFADAVADLPDRAVACGRDHIELLMRVGHGLDLDAGQALAIAEADFARLGEEMAELAARADPARSWRAQIDDLSRATASAPDAVRDLYRSLDRETAGAGAALVTVAGDYGLDYRWLPPWCARIAGPLYFLPYRSPPAGAPGRGSIYWVFPPGDDAGAYLAANSVTNTKVIQAVHHGSVGHHTQNARARAAASGLARVAGTDCALGLAFLPAGTMVEGWACHAQDMMAEAPGFYSPAELVYLKQMERRNAASVLVDIRLHTGEWSPGEAAAFYRDEAGFAPARVMGEIVRNAMLPGTRLMYWLGVRRIRDMRARWRGGTRDFHDTLIGHGHVPVAWADEEMTRAGLLA